MKGLDTTHCEVQVDSNIWRWEATPCIRLTFENHANRLHIAKISSYIWSKFGLLCWDAFIVITGCMWPVGHILKCFILSQRAECSILASKWVRCSFLWHSASFGRACKIWINPCIQKHQKKPSRDKPSNKDGSSRENKCHLVSSGGSPGNDKENHGPLGIVVLKLIY